MGKDYIPYRFNEEREGEKETLRKKEEKDKENL